MLTLAELHHEHKADCITYCKAIALAKSGKLPGIGEYRLGHGWPITNQDAVLAAIKKDNN